MAKRCREPYECGQGPVTRFKRDDGRMVPLEPCSNTETLLHLIRTMEEINTPESTTDVLLELLNNEINVRH